MPDVQTPVGTTRLITLSMLSSSNLLAAMRRSIEFNACCRVRHGATIVNELTVDEEHKEATLTYSSGDDASEVQHSVLCSLAMWMRVCGWLIGQHIDITSATCAGPQPGFLAGMRHFFPCPVAYGKSTNAIAFINIHTPHKAIFGIDYADGFNRPDTNISVFFDPDGLPL